MKTCQIEDLPAMGPVRVTSVGPTEILFTDPTGEQCIAHARDLRPLPEHDDAQQASTVDYHDPPVLPYLLAAAVLGGILTAIGLAVS